MANKIAYSRPGVYAKGFATTKRNLELLTKFAELAARQDCVLPSSKSCREKEDYSEALWCLPCRAQDTLDKVNTLITDEEMRKYR